MLRRPHSLGAGWEGGGGGGGGEEGGGRGRGGPRGVSGGRELGRVGVEGRWRAESLHTHKSAAW